MAGKRSVPTLKPRFRVVRGEDIALGPGKVELLALLAETGSLNETARRLEMSYMRAWTLVKMMNKHFRRPIVISERGGRAGGGMKLTATGKKALTLYREMESSALKSAAPAWESLQKLLRS